MDVDRWRGLLLPGWFDDDVTVADEMRTKTEMTTWGSREKTEMSVRFATMRGTERVRKKGAGLTESTVTAVNSDGSSSSKAAAWRRNGGARRGRIRRDRKSVV